MLRGREIRAIAENRGFSRLARGKMAYILKFLEGKGRGKFLGVFNFWLKNVTVLIFSKN